MGFFCLLALWHWHKSIKANFLLLFYNSLFYVLISVNILILVNYFTLILMVTVSKLSHWLMLVNCKNNIVGRLYYAIVTDLLGRIPSLENKPFVAQAHHFRMYRIAQSGARAIYLTNLRYEHHTHRSSLGRTTLLTADTTLQVCELMPSYHAQWQDLVTFPVQLDLSLFFITLVR